MDYKPFKMKGFPMQKGTGSYLKESSAVKMKKEAMAKQAKPDFPDIDGDGNTTESMKKAAADKKGSPAPQKMSYKEAFDYMTGEDKSDKRKIRKAKRKVRKSIRKGEKMEGEAFPGHFNMIPGSMYREGTKENEKMKKRSAAPQKEHPAITKYNKAVKDAKNEYETFIGKLHSEGRADTTGYSKTGGVGSLTTVDKKAVEKARKQAEKKIKAAQKQAKKDGLKLTKQK